jgi:AcrR family transcriptional regulator
VARTRPAAQDDAEKRVLDAAERLFYARGVHAVGMDDVRAQAQLSLKRLYRLFPAKDRLVEAYLDRRDEAWRSRLAERVDRCQEPVERILAVFDHLHAWFHEPDFRGCAWINAYGELGATSPAVAQRARHHKTAFRGYLRSLAGEAGLSAADADRLWLLAEGAMASAGILGDPDLALRAREAAAVLTGAARAGNSGVRS